MIRFLQLFFVLCFVAFTSLFAQNSGGISPNQQSNGNVYLPGSMINSLSLELVTAPGDNTKLKKFRSKYGNWSFLIDKQTGLIQRAFGKGIQIVKDGNVNRETIENSSIDFLTANSDIFGIDINTIKLIRTKYINNHWYISYKQYYQGMEVLLSEIELRIGKNGKMSNFGMLFYPGISLNGNESIITRKEAEQFATIGIPFNPVTDRRTVEKNMYILPYTVNGKIIYKRVYKVDIQTEEPFAHYFAYVDAHNGKTLWRQNMVLNANELISQGKVKMKFASDTFKMQPFPNMYITVDGKRKTTDYNGKISLENSDTAVINAKFTGKWATVKLRRAPQSTADYTTNIPPNEDYILTWIDSISHKTERILYYHANVMHDYVRTLDTALKEMDFQLSITIDFGGTNPNAASSGKSINFIGVGNTTMRMAESPQVLYHEYGHSVNLYLYKSQGAPNGMMNLSCNEGTADLFSTMIQDEPKMGVGVWVYQPNKIIRTLENTLKYPDDIQADGHHNGQILGGAFWDLREATSLDYVRKLSHFTKYGTPDDPNVGKAFSEWFLETLNTDDDDGDFSNGTPHINEIITAFNLHNIGTNLFLQYGFTHKQYPNTLETKKPYPIEFKLQALPIPNGTPDSVMLYWSIDDFQTLNSSPATLKDEQTGLYEALIPPQAAGTIVKYYMHAWEPISKTPVNFYKSTYGNKPYIFLVGYKTISVDNFENSDWTVGSNQDRATRGKWENGIPNMVDLSAYGLGIVQPGKDYSEDGMKCWVTGAKGSTVQYYQYMPNGRTTLTSGNYDISSYIMPLIKYEKWFFNIYGASMPGYETYWKTNISFDDGNTWQRVENTKSPTDGWESTYIELTKIKPDTAKQFKIQFVFDAPSSYQLISLNEGLIDDFEILDVDRTLVSVQEGTNEDKIIYSYPNPFSDGMHFVINGTSQENVKIDIFNILGQKVKTILTGNNSHGFAADWDGTDFDGRKLEAGIYMYQVIINGQIHTGKLIKN